VVDPQSRRPRRYAKSGEARGSQTGGVRLPYPRQADELDYESTLLQMTGHN
jgi:hypothetical protein